MRSPCCMDDALLCPKASSCSMILRSACAHGSYKNSLMVDELLTRRDRRFKRKPSHRRTSDESKDQASWLAGCLQVMNRASCASLECSFLQVLNYQNENKNEAKNHTSNVSSLMVNKDQNNRNLLDSCLSLSSSVSAMSQGRRRQHAQSPMRALSGSEDEETAFVEQSMRVRGTRSSRTISASQTTAARNSGSQINYAVNHSSINHINDSSASNHSSQTPSVSRFDQLRWRIWKYVYMANIQILFFDVYLLWRAQRFGRYKILSLLLLLVILYLFTREGSGLLTSSSTFVQYLWSSFYSLLHLAHSFTTNFFSEESWISNCLNLSSFVPSLSGTAAYFSTLFSKSTASNNAIYSHIKYKDSTADNEILVKRIANLEHQIQTLLLHQKNKETERNIIEEINSISVQLSSCMASIKQLETNTADTKRHALLQQNMLFEDVNVKLRDIEQKLVLLEDVKKCCNEKLNIADAGHVLEKYFIAAFHNMMKSKDNLQSPFYSLRNSLDHHFVSEQKLQTELHSFLTKIRDQQRAESRLNEEINLQHLKRIVQEYVDATNSFSTFADDFKAESGDSLEHIRKIVKEALMLYDADKTGKVDYALESGGGSVLGTRCSESYLDKNGRLSIFGLPFWSDRNSPRTAIQPDMQPGRCWAFKGNQGFLVIQLSYKIRPTGFTLEHIPGSLSPTGSIDSAPKDFSVWGLESETDTTGELIGEYSYNKDGEPLQYFPAKNITISPFLFVELKIHSNHGNLEYTCLYRFRVHGNRIE